jgi:hypothetical protein
MDFTPHQLDSIEVNFILCTERTGSSLLTLMLNLNVEICSPFEEQFALYLADRYGDKEHFTEIDLKNYVNDFFIISETNTELFFSSKDVFLKNLLKHRSILNYERLVKLTYLNFYSYKDKSEVKVIVDKQIKSFFHLKQLKKLFPSAKYIVLVRDVRDNIVSRKERSLNWSGNHLYLSYLWKDTYRNIELLKSDFYLLKYENFIQETESELKNICLFLGVNYSNKMLQTKNVFETILENKKINANTLLINQIKDFHSGLISKPNVKKIAQYNKLPIKILSEINALCKEELLCFGYQIDTEYCRVPIIRRIYFSVLAKCYRKWLLQLYLPLPLGLKIFFKKLRKKINKP